MNSDTVPAKHLLTLIHQLQHDGIADEQINSALVTDIPTLETKAAHGERIAIEQYGKLYRLYLEQMNAKNFAFPDTMGHTLGRYQMIFLLMVNSTTLGDALQKLQGFIDTFSISGQLIDFHQLNEQHIACDLTFLMQQKYRGTAQESRIAANLTAIFQRVLSWLTGVAINPLSVEFQGGEPDTREDYEKLFGCKVAFQAPHNRLIYPCTILDYGIVQDEASLEHFLADFPTPLMSNHSHQQESLTLRTRALIGHNLRRELPAVQEIAKMLSLSPSHFKQGLKDEGTTYHKLLETVRKEQAIELLDDSNLDLSAISEQLGFPATSAFHRSFKRWIGMTPGSYRERKKN